MQVICCVLIIIVICAKCLYVNFFGLYFISFCIYLSSKGSSDCVKNNSYGGMSEPDRQNIFDIMKYIFTNNPVTDHKQSYQSDSAQFTESSSSKLNIQNFSPHRNICDGYNNSERNSNADILKGYTNPCVVINKDDVSCGVKKSTSQHRHMLHCELEGLQAIVRWLESLPVNKRFVPKDIENPELLLADVKVP